MRSLSARNAIKRVAEKEGVSAEEISAEIEFAIREAMEKALAEQDSNAMDFWEKIPREGIMPTAEDVVAYLAAYLNETSPVD